MKKVSQGCNHATNMTPTHSCRKTDTDNNRQIGNNRRETVDASHFPRNTKWDKIHIHFNPDGGM